MSPFLDRGKVLLNGIQVRGIGGQKKQRMPCLVDQLSGRGRFMKGGIVHDEDRVGCQLLKEMLLEPGIKPLRIRTPLKQHGREQSLATFARQQAGAGPSIAAPFSRNLLPSTRPAMGSVCGPLKPTFIQIDHLRGPLCRKDMPKLLKIGFPLGRISFSVP